MVKSGFLFGVVAFVLVLASSLISPLCAPCLGLILGLSAGYVAGIFDKPGSPREGVRIGGIAGAIAGGIGFFGGLIGGMINSTTLNVSTIEQIYRSWGITNVTLTQSQIFLYQLIGACFIGVFNIVWMAVLGIAGAALWYQVKGKSQSGTIPPPQEPLLPRY